jgi:hypothetical protein
MATNVVSKRIPQDLGLDNSNFWSFVCDLFDEIFNWGSRETKKKAMEKSNFRKFKVIYDGIRRYQRKD